jgi:hypothetical protein
VWPRIAFSNRHCFSFLFVSSHDDHGLSCLPGQDRYRAALQVVFLARGISSAEGKKLLAVMIDGLRVGFDKAGRGWNVRQKEKHVFKLKAVLLIVY